ncbi:unnamed protein product [Lymnaea stagnalis]|uniref:High-affinity choline transporter 1 n=1 Tax=Lymnaea stagnalis TaxID=6523 RepID=A0AAV2HYF9_LYMST
MAVNVPCLIAVIVLYVVILVIGIVAARKTNKTQDSEEVMVANRHLGLVVACFTMTATFVCGGLLNGTAEYAAWHGLLQTQAPLCYTVGVFISGIVIAPKMRRERYVTMFDPFQFKYGRKMGSLLIIPHMLGDLFWSAAVLAALGATISIIVDINATVSIIVSALIAVIYTFLGGLYAVAYTDVIQMVMIAIGMIIAFPFALTHPHVHLENISDTWLGDVPAGTEWAYFDIACLLVFGGSTWQAVYQRVLACKTPKIAMVSTMVASVVAFLMAIPAYMLGIAGAAADWNSTSYEGPIPIPEDQKSNILPLTLTYLVPLPVSIIGLGAISAAVMSSADSCFLSSATILTKNIYKDIFREKASDRELLWVLRICVVICGTLGTVVAVFSTTIYGLFVLCSDLMYVVLFPQLISVLWIPWSNTYGSSVGFFVSFTLRILSGDSLLKIPAAIKWPMYDYVTDTQLFPFRTFAMLVGVSCVIMISGLTHFLFVRGHLSVKYDIFNCHRQRTHHKHTSSASGVHADEDSYSMIDTIKSDELFNQAKMKL